MYRERGGGGSRSEMGPVDRKRINDALDKHLERSSPSTSRIMNAFEMITLSQGLNLSPLFGRRQWGDGDGGGLRGGKGIVTVKKCPKGLFGTFPVTVYGAFLPRHIFYHLHAACAYLQCIFVALCVLFMCPSFDVILADQVSVVIPLMKLKKSAKVVFYCHFPDLLLTQHTTILRRIYRKPIDFIEEVTTGIFSETKEIFN
ncbi:Alpha-1,3/1,6-mannosyltransferase ALG2 [Camellia lanceoleosa]|uniref:Alpha-1,3/1,6-mannosyltransferase ALG2 n=1 Tax=Camellia lanceoleosa TaxID=1840588 RepID=A0ACC0FK07_9ERIC|nr:Alpha-1,3/1,6-mannosyltransferase ALG2 [Camellia lanceoleosa]